MTSAKFNFFKEKLILQQEEKELKKMLEKFQDQQNRLKIEELALISMIKMEKEKKTKGSSHSVRGQGPSSSFGSMSLASSLCSADMNDFVPVGSVHKTQEVAENAEIINQESLNLSVGNPFHQQALVMNGDEEEEDSDEEEEEREEEISAAERHQLMSFMDGF